MRNFKKSDWYGLGLSVALHVGLIVLFALTTMGASEQVSLGYIEVEMGPFSQGRPVQRAAVQTPEPSLQPEPERPQLERRAAPPEEAKPVDLPTQTEQILDDEAVTSPETEVISPTTSNEPAEVVDPEPQPERRTVQPLGGGSLTGTLGSAAGDDGSGETEQRTAPYQIEGLDNRRLLSRRDPEYAEKVVADIRYEITVDPRGRIVRTRPVIKANAALEGAIRDALRDWRFDQLPPNAPQVDQTGYVIFHFRLR